MFGVGDGGVTITGTKTGTDVHAGFGGEPPKLVFDLVGSGDHQGVQLVDGLGTVLDRRTAGHRQHPYCFYWSVPAFGQPGGLPVKSSPRRCLGVGDIGLAEAAA